jgi:hypothetical protein
LKKTHEEALVMKQFDNMVGKMASVESQKMISAFARTGAPVLNLCTLWMLLHAASPLKTTAPGIVQNQLPEE